jgi:glucuronate isomerase
MKDLLSSRTAERLYGTVKDLPIIDYHCHLNPRQIRENATFADIGEFWLSGDHYKWRAMRIMGVDEKFITGDASYEEKFKAYASVVPYLVGNPLYDWTHRELRDIFGIDEPLCAENADSVYKRANAVLKDLSVWKLLDKFNVEFIATTDDPIDSLEYHGVVQNTRVTPTFRPDKLQSFSQEYISALSKASGKSISTLEDLKAALCNRLDFFVSKGCKFSDHGFAEFPAYYPSDEEAENLFDKRDSLTADERQALWGYVLLFLTKEYAKRDITMQIHFGVLRNVNPKAFAALGPDSGYDVIGEAPKTQDVLRYFALIGDDERPKTVLYCLNDAALTALACLTGAYAKVVMGAAWWFNDNKAGIERNLEIISQYSLLAPNLGMLTDSRSFSSYCRFDFFRRIVCSFLADKVDKGECTFAQAKDLLARVCYSNAKARI